MAGASAASREAELAVFWLQDARRRPVDQEAWAVLIAQLRMAAYREQTGVTDSKLPEGLSSVAAMVGALHDFLLAHDFAREERLPALTARLMMSIEDVSEGRSSPLFEPRFKGSTRTRVVKANVSAIAARALTALVEDGLNLKEASLQVSRAVKAGKLAGHSKCTAATVRNWRAQFDIGDGAATRETLLRYRVPLPEEAGTTPRAQAAWLLAQLRNSPALRYG